MRSAMRLESLTHCAMESMATAFAARTKGCRSEPMYYHTGMRCSYDYDNKVYSIDWVAAMHCAVV